MGIAKIRFHEMPGFVLKIAPDFKDSYGVFFTYKKIEFVMTFFPNRKFEEALGHHHENNNYYNSDFDQLPFIVCKNKTNLHQCSISSRKVRFHQDILDTLRFIHACRTG